MQKRTSARSYSIRKSSSSRFALRTAHKRCDRRHNKWPNIDGWLYERGSAEPKNDLSALPVDFVGFLKCVIL